MMCKFINDKNIAFPKMQRFLQYRNNKIDILCLTFAIFTNMQYCKIPFYACFFCFLCDFPNFFALALDLYQECRLYTKYRCVLFAFVKLIA